jgi:hypothetical protein
MQSSRASLVFLAALATLACRSPSSDPIIDETGEDDCPGCFDAEGMLWNLQGAWHEGGLHPVNTSAGERPALLEVKLIDGGWSAQAPEGHECTMRYTPSAVQGDNPQAAPDWVIALEAVEDGCGELDPDWVDPALFERLPVWGVTMAGEPLDADMTDYLRAWYEEFELDWETDGAPYYFGMRATIDGRTVYEDAQGEVVQGHYGRAYQIDDDLNIVAEGAGGVLLGYEEISAGASGWFEVYAATFFSPFNELN